MHEDYYKAPKDEIFNKEVAMKPTITNGEEKRWSLFIDGTEVSNFLRSFDAVASLGDAYLEDGYDSVVAYQYDTGEEVRIA